MKKKNLLFSFALLSCLSAGAQKINVVTDLAHEFSFYADHRFHTQYLKNQRYATNWCNLSNFDFSNANLLVLLGCDNRLEYNEDDVATIKRFLKSGGGVVMLSSEGATAQNALMQEFGASVKGGATAPFRIVEKGVSASEVEGNGHQTLQFDEAKKWKPVIEDANGKALMAYTKYGKGHLLVGSRSLSGSNPDASDSINVNIWKPVLEKITSGKSVRADKPFNSRGIGDLEHVENKSTFTLMYNDYMKPYASAMTDIAQRCMPVIEKRMGVPLAPGMGSKIALLATGGGGFSSGDVIALAVWWGDFPKREDSMIEFITHESVHSWVLPFAEVWNEPIATYVGDLVMCDMGYPEEGLRRINAQIESARRFDRNMDTYDLDGTDRNGNKVEAAGMREIHWGKTYYVFELLRVKHPDFLARYFQMKRFLIAQKKITKYDIHNTVAVMSLALGEDLFDFFNSKGIKADRTKAEIKL